MFEIDDWAWLIVAALWLIFRVLPRLFRKGRSESIPTEPRKAPSGRSIPELDGDPIEAPMAASRTAEAGGVQSVGEISSRPIEPR